MQDPLPDALKRAADLSRLGLEPAELERLTPDVERILGSFERLLQVEVQDAEPLARLGSERAPLRADRARTPGPGAEDGSPAPEALLEAAPRREEAFFRVPKTLGDGA